MASEPNIAELAVAAWRLERWLDNLNADRKMAAKKSIREIKSYLDASGIEIVDPLGWKFDPGLAIEIVNNEAPDVEESELIVIQTSAPIIKKEGAVVQYGKVILGTDVKEQKVSNQIKDDVSEIVNDEKVETKSTEKASPYFIKLIELYEDREGFMPCVEVNMGMHALNNSLRVFLMDKFNYRECFSKGINPQTAHGFIQNKPKVLMEIPYPGDWYVVIYSEDMVWKDEYEVETVLSWYPKKEETKEPATEENSNASETVLEENIVNEDITDENAESENEKTNEADVGVNETEDVNITKESKDDDLEIIEPKMKPEINISEKASEKLAKKNNTSYFKEMAKLSGFQMGSHKKSSKKGKKHK